MKFALYRYEFEVMEKKDSSASLFPDQRDNLTPRQAFEKKSELLNKLLKDDYTELTTERPLDGNRLVMKPRLHFSNGKNKPLQHQYVADPKDGFTILQLAKRLSVSRCSKPFQANAEKEDDYKLLHIIIDNRGTHQHVAIEMNSDFNTEAVAASLARALCRPFSVYGLEVKVVPVREDKHFWKVVGNKELYSKGFKSLLVVFPQINDPEVSKGLNELGIGYHRQHFGTGLWLLHKSPKGESIPFDEKDAYQRSFMNLASLYGDTIKLTPMSGRTITFGGECAKTGEIPGNIIQGITEKKHEQALFGMDAMSKAKEYMDNFYTKR